MRKSAFTKVVCEPYRGVEWLDLDEINPSGALEAKQTLRNFIYTLLQGGVPRPVCAVKDKRTLTVGGGNKQKYTIGVLEAHRAIGPPKQV